MDAADFDWLNQWKWYASGRDGGRIYAARRDAEQGRRLVYMHRVILAPALGVNVDHADGNSLLNSRANLRAATVGQNIANARHQSRRKWPYRGVERTSNNGRWRARIKGAGGTGHIGCFDTAEEAARAFDAAALRLYGEFATLNFPQAVGG